jgi:two-component system NtrC family sensor kinase/two-component system sensor histidine kinase AtoS
MISKELLNSLSIDEKDAFKNTLESIINQTYIVENEYKELNKSYQNLQNIIEDTIDVLPNAIWVLDENGEVFLNNSEAKKLENLFKIIDLTHNSYELELDKQYYMIKIIKNKHQTIITATDITEEKRKDRLISMGQMAAHLAHEIRNPVGSVALLASTLLKKVDTKYKPIVFEIKRSVWRVERIIKATLLFSKGLELNKSFFDLTSLIDDFDTAINHYSYLKEIQFKTNLPNIEIYADADLLSIVFQNFIFNAIDAIEDSDEDTGVVEIHYVKDSKFHIFHIFDNGKAIENKDILFEPYKSTKTKGNGLGLSLSLEIIQKHNGNIRLLESKKKGFEIKIEKIKRGY